MTSAPPTTPIPLPPKPGELADPELRERYLTDAARQREARRAEAAQLAAQTRPSRTPTGPIRVIAALVAVVLVALVSASLVGPMLKQSETREHALGEVTAVNFTGGVGDVRIRAAEPGESPKAVVTSTWGLWKPSTSVRTSEGTATLRSSCPSRSFGSVCGTDWLVVVPADTDLRIEQGVGAVEIEDVAGDIWISTGVGDVAVTGAESEQLDVEMGVGSFSYEGVEPPESVDVRLGVGDVSLRLPDTVGYRVTASGAAGLANSLGHDPASDRTVHVEAGVGSVAIDPS